MDAATDDPLRGDPDDPAVVYLLSLLRPGSIDAMSKRYAVYEHETGKVWRVEEDSKRAADREAETQNIDDGYETLTAMPLKKAKELAKAFAHGVHAALTAPTNSTDQHAPKGETR